MKYTPWALSAALFAHFSKVLVLGLLFGLFGAANAEQMVFSRAAFVSNTGQELSVGDGTAWKISFLPTRFCQLGQSCPSIIIDGQFKVGDNGETRTGKAALSSQQLGGQPLWIMAGAKVTIPDGVSGIQVQEFIFSLAPEKQKIPVAVTFRNSALGNGLVTIYTNQSTEPLILYVTVKNATYAPKTFRVDLPPNGSRELGHLEGWAFNYGDLITVVMPGHENEYEPLNTRL